MSTESRTTKNRALLAPGTWALGAALAGIVGCAPADIPGQGEIGSAESALAIDRNLGGGLGGIDIGDLDELEPWPELVADFPTETTQKVPFAVALCRFAGETAAHSRTSVQTLMGATFPGMDDYFRRSSFSALSLDGTKVTNFREIGPRASYQAANGNLDGFRIVDDCFAQARQELNLSPFDHAMVVINDANVSVVGSASGTKGQANYRPSYFAMDSRNVSNASLLARSIAKELGQGLTPRHAMSGSAPFTSRWDGFNYGDCGTECPLVRPIATHMEQLGWLPASRVFTPAGPGSFDLHIERAGLPSTSGPIVAKIPTGPASYLTVETRRWPEGFDYDQNLVMEGVVIHEVNLDSPFSTNATLVDVDGAGPNDEGSSWGPGEVFASPTGATVSVESFPGTGADVRITVPGHRLTINKQVSGSCGGKVTTINGHTGIDCGTDCTENYLRSVSTVTLRATPSQGAVFKGWSGCGGTQQACTAVMDRDRTVTATFECKPVDCYGPCLESCKEEGHFRVSQCVQLCRAECADP